MKDETLQNKKEVKFDNLYDLLIDSSNTKLKDNLTSIVFTGDRVDFLENQGQNVQFHYDENSNQLSKVLDADKLKIGKQFKFVNPLPKFQSVPAAPQFFDMAGAHIQYPDLTESLNKYRPQGGLFKKLTGFFGRS